MCSSQVCLHGLIELVQVTGPLVGKTRRMWLSNPQGCLRSLLRLSAVLPGCGARNFSQAKCVNRNFFWCKSAGVYTPPAPLQGINSDKLQLVKPGPGEQPPHRADLKKGTMKFLERLNKKRCTGACRSKLSAPCLTMPVWSSTVVLPGACHISKARTVTYIALRLTATFT